MGSTKLHPDPYSTHLAAVRAVRGRDPKRTSDAVLRALVCAVYEREGDPFDDAADERAALVVACARARGSDETVAYFVGCALYAGEPPPSRGAAAWARAIERAIEG